MVWYRIVWCTSGIPETKVLRMIKHYMQYTLYHRGIMLLCAVYYLPFMWYFRPLEIPRLLQQITAEALLNQDGLTGPADGIAAWPKHCLRGLLLGSS